MNARFEKQLQVPDCPRNCLWLIASPCVPRGWSLSVTLSPWVPAASPAVPQLLSLFVPPPTVPECPSAHVPGCPAELAPTHPGRAGRRGARGHVQGCQLMPLGAKSSFSRLGTPEHPEQSGGTSWHAEATAKNGARGSRPFQKRRLTRSKMMNLGLKATVSSKSGLLRIFCRGGRGTWDPKQFRSVSNKTHP
jgi:hypothetical protein